MARELLAAPVAQGDQCPRMEAGWRQSNRATSGQQHDRVEVHPETGARSFSARIVGIFSCLDAELSTNNDLTLDFRLAKPAIDLAVARVNEKYSPSIKFNVTYRTADDICEHQMAAGHAAEEYYVNGANYFVGPGCSDSLAAVGQLASYWRVPMCSTGYLPEMTTARFRPLTLMQVSLSVQSVGEMLYELFQMYNWRHLVILTDDNHPLHPLIRNGLLEFFHTIYKLSPSVAATPSTSGAARSPLMASVTSGIPTATTTTTIAGGGGTIISTGNSLLGVTGDGRHVRVAPPSATSGSENYWNRHSQRVHYLSHEQEQQQQQLPGETQHELRRPEHLSPLPVGPASLQQAYYINITTRNFAAPTISSKGPPVDYDKLLLESAGYSRVMLFLAGSESISGLLGAAHRHGLTGGQFVFIAHELFETQGGGGTRTAEKSSTTTGSGRTQQSNSNSRNSSLPNSYMLDDEIEVAAGSAEKGFDGTGSVGPKQPGGGPKLSAELEKFQSLMKISLRIPSTPELIRFRAQVANQSERQFQYHLPPSSLKSHYALGLASFIYDCVMLYADKVAYVLERTQLQSIDGETVFRLTAGDTFTGGVSGNLTINEVGQRVIDFTLNSFSPRSLSFEPIAHFTAMNRTLAFLPAGQPPWVAWRNQSAPRSDPRCRRGETLCRKLTPWLGAAGQFEDELEAALADRVVVGVWLAGVIVGSVALTSSLIGFLVYRRFRIESELLNLWWSIKYEDIVFEDEPDGLGCDGKRSMSSLAVSNESFALGQMGGVVETGSGPNRSTSPQHQVVIGGQQPGELSTRQLTLQPQQQVQLSVSQDPALPAGGTCMSAAHSISTLSVTGPGSSVSAPAGPSLTGSGRAGNQGGAIGGGPLRAQSRQIPTAAAGASKLIPLISKTLASGGSGLRNQQASGNHGSLNLSGSSGQLGRQQGTAANKGPAGGHSATGNQNPSISSQNKNAKLRLGAVLNGAHELGHAQTKVGLYKASRVAVKHLNVRQLSVNRQLLIELRQVRDLTHENLIKFIGLCPEEPNVAIVSELCTRGNLQDLLQNDTIRLDWSFRYSILNDIVDGLIHLHSSPVGFHGRLKSSNCVIDNRFVVKLTDFGLPTLLAVQEDDGEPVNPRLLLWTAPEHLRTKRPLLSGSQKGDIYSLAIIFQEIITRCGPFECEPILCGTTAAADLTLALDPWQQQQQQQLAPPTRKSAAAPAARWQPGGRSLGPPLQPSALLRPVVVQHKQRLEPEEIVNLVRMGLSPPFRPYFRPDLATTGAGEFQVADLIAVVQSCWQEAPALRPTVASVKQQIKKMRRAGHLDSANLMDNLLQRMERYTDNLESLVEQKTAELMEEKKRSEELLYEMLPRFVVDQLKYGHSVTPEAYEAVTISFSDIKDFTSIAAQSSPIEVVNLLNQLYTEFDDCIAQYDVYKVETIGDAYMVVSGLPVRNGDLHAKEIAEMSLALLDLIRNFEVAHMPHHNLELRIGCHSGPCASGVVGTRMFRYCLFGDTVNTASRMESYGEPMKIHISEDSANILSKFGTFTIEPRGEVEIKGKGPMNTFWLTGKTDDEFSS